MNPRSATARAGAALLLVTSLLASAPTARAQACDLETPLDCLQILAECPSVTTGGSKNWEFYLNNNQRDFPDNGPLPTLYYIATWAGVTHFDGGCTPTAYHCLIEVEDSWFKTVGVRAADGSWDETTTGSYHGVPVYGGYAACGSDSASVDTEVGLLLPLVGYTVDVIG